MYKKYQKFGGLVLAILMAVAMPVQTLAASNRINYEVCVAGTMIPVEEYDSEWMYNTLSEIGFTDDEMFELYQKEADKTGVNIHLPDRLANAIGVDYAYTHFNRVVPYASTPQDGDVRYDSYDVNFEAIAKICGWTGKGLAVSFIVGQVTKDAFIKAVIGSTGLGWVGAATTLIGGLFDWLMDHTDSTGCTITVKYAYQYDPYEGFGKWYMVDAYYVLW